MFRLLEDKKSALGIKTFGITDCGLEQVFIKVTKSSEMESQCMSGGVPTALNDGINHVIEFDGNNDDSTEADYVQLREIGRDFIHYVTWSPGV